MRDRLEAMKVCLAKEEGAIVLEGHCDPRGTTEYNMALGDRRARRVKKLLGLLGMETAEIKTRSKGEEEALGYNEDTWANDRRVDFE